MGQIKIVLGTIVKRKENYTYLSELEIAVTEVCSKPQACNLQLLKLL